MLKPNSSNNVTSRVSKSAILAGAALALPLASKADIVVHTADISVVSDSTTGDVSFSLNLNPLSDGALGDSVNDFQFTASFSNQIDTVTPLGSNGYVGTDPNKPTALQSGIVGPTDTFEFGTGILQQTMGDFQAGPWPGANLGVLGKPNGFAYLGVEFNIDSALHYGWVHLSACTPDFFTSCGAGIDPAVITIDSYAYESAANTPITIPGTPTPEPSFLPLLALGAAGLGAFRARRKKAA
jgi:hypothetical protein